MTVAVNCATAAVLIAEGAICLDADQGVATREGRMVAIPSVEAHCGAPILVCGSASAVNDVAQALEAEGLPAWRVTDPAASADCCRHAG